MPTDLNIYSNNLTDKLQFLLQKDLNYLKFFWFIGILFFIQWPIKPDWAILIEIGCPTDHHIIVYNSAHKV